MTTKTNRPISQPDSRHRTRSSTATTLHHSFKSNVAQQCYRLRSSTRASSAARLHPRPKSERPVGAQPHRLRSLTRAISAGRNPARRGVKLIHGSAIKTDDPTRIIVLSDRRESKGRSRLHLIYGSAIKSHRKPCGFNYLLISNRRQRGGTALCYLIHAGI